MHNCRLSINKITACGDAGCGFLCGILMENQGENGTENGAKMGQKCAVFLQKSGYLKK